MHGSHTGTARVMTWQVEPLSGEVWDTRHGLSLQTVCKLSLLPMSLYVRMPSSQFCLHAHLAYSLRACGVPSSHPLSKPNDLLNLAPFAGRQGKV